MNWHRHVKQQSYRRAMNRDTYKNNIHKTEEAFYLDYLKITMPVTRKDISEGNITQNERYFYKNP